jgi:nicotinate-nucleotide adenylyltransferase
MRTGILGGTFDPIHNGHLAIAAEAQSYLNLHEVIFLPAGKPWMKADREISPAAHRIEMIRLAIASIPNFTLSTMEIEDEGPSYSVDTLARMKAQAVEPSEWYFIIGWDNLARMPQWKEPLRLVEMCYLVAAPRPGAERPNLKVLEAAIPGISRKVILLDKPRVNIAATEIRERVAQGLSINGMVPAAVETYIQENGLYKK